MDFDLVKEHSTTLYILFALIDTCRDLHHLSPYQGVSCVTAAMLDNCCVAVSGQLNEGGCLVI